MTRPESMYFEADPRLHEVRTLQQPHHVQELESTLPRLLSEGGLGSLRLHRDSKETELKMREGEHRLQAEVEAHENTKRELERLQNERECTIIAKQRLELELRTHKDELACVEGLRLKCKEHERNEQELRDQLRILSSHKTSSDNQAAERERELQQRLASSTEALKRLEGEKRLMQVELDRRCQAEGETRELRCSVAELEDHLRDSKEKEHRADIERQRAERDQYEWYQKFCECNKENVTLKKADQEKRRDLFLMEQELLQERSASEIATPGGLVRMMRTYESESFKLENERLKLALKKCQQDVELCLRKLESQEAAIKERDEEILQLRGC